MAKSQQTYNKKEKEKKRLKKRQDKILKKEDRKSNSLKLNFEDMIAYVDDNGMIVDTPPDHNYKKREILAENIEIGVPKKNERKEDIILKSGKVSFYDTSKGFGFINDIISDEKYFFHISGLIDQVKENDKVTFELEKGLKGMNAIKIKITL